MELKRTIDLTANRDFRKKFNLSEFRGILNNKGKRYPWSPGTFDKLVGSLDSKKELLLTGTREERASKKANIKRNAENSCDCCGYYSEKKWEFKYNLCKRCREYGEEESYKRTLWFFRNYSIIRRQRI